MSALDRNRPLTDLLAERGFTHRHAPNAKQYAREIVDASGAVVFVGDYDDVAAWLAGSASGADASAFGVRS